MVSRVSESSSSPNQEFDAAVGWWKTQLKPVLCNDEAITKFECSLRRCILDKLSFHWFPDTPRKGQAYRSISLDRIGRLDPILRTACHEAKISNIFEYFPYVDAIIMWIDPGEVAVKTFWHYAKSGTEEIVYKKEGTSRVVSGGGGSGGGGSGSKGDLKRDEFTKTKQQETFGSCSSKRMDTKMISVVKKIEIPSKLVRSSASCRKSNVQQLQRQQQTNVLRAGGIWSTTSVGDWDDWNNYTSLNV